MFSVALDVGGDPKGKPIVSFNGCAEPWPEGARKIFGQNKDRVVRWSVEGKRVVFHVGKRRPFEERSAAFEGRGLITLNDDGAGRVWVELLSVSLSQEQVAEECFLFDLTPDQVQFDARTFAQWGDPDRYLPSPTSKTVYMIPRNISRVRLRELLGRVIWGGKMKGSVIADIGRNKASAMAWIKDHLEFRFPFPVASMASLASRTAKFEIQVRLKKGKGDKENEWATLVVTPDGLCEGKEGPRFPRAILLFLVKRFGINLISSYLSAFQRDVLKAGSDVDAACQLIKECFKNIFLLHRFPKQRPLLLVEHGDLSSVLNSSDVLGKALDVKCEDRPFDDEAMRDSLLEIHGEALIERLFLLAVEAGNIFKYTPFWQRFRAFEIDGTMLRGIVGDDRSPGSLKAIGLVPVGRYFDLLGGDMVAAANSGGEVKGEGRFNEVIAVLQDGEQAFILEPSDDNNIQQRMEVLIPRQLAQGDARHRILVRDRKGDEYGIMEYSLIVREGVKARWLSTSVCHGNLPKAGAEEYVIVPNPWNPQCPYVLRRCAAILGL